MTDDKTSGDRIAKVMARAGVASRRDAERMIVEGRVAVNGKPVTSPALDVLPSDRVTLDGKPIDAPQATRVWLYYKPLGLVSSNKDEKGRQTVFDTLPDDMPRVMSIGRLDLNSEGLLLLTNDGALKRRLELPSTGWLRKYRVRINGRPNDATFDPLRRGMTIDGEDFLPMEIILDRQQGANAWLTVGLREGKNREIRRAMTEVGMIVNRLIRVSYGPFRLNLMKPGDVVEVKQRVLREQLGANVIETTSDDAHASRARAPRADGAGSDRKPRPPRTGGTGFDRKPGTPRALNEGFDRKPRAPRAEGAGFDRKPGPPRAEGSDFERKPRPPRAESSTYDRKPRAPRAEGAGFERKPRPPRAEGAGFERKPRPPRAEGAGFERKPRPPRAEGAGFDRKPRPPRAEGAGFERKPRPDATGKGPGKAPRGGSRSGPRSGAGGGTTKPPRGPGKK